MFCQSTDSFLGSLKRLKYALLLFPPDKAGFMSGHRLISTVQQIFTHNSRTSIQHMFTLGKSKKLRQRKVSLTGSSTKKSTSLHSCLARYPVWVFEPSKTVLWVFWAKWPIPHPIPASKRRFKAICGWGIHVLCHSKDLLQLKPIHQCIWNLDSTHLTEQWWCQPYGVEKQDWVRNFAALGRSPAGSFSNTYKDRELINWSTKSFPPTNQEMSIEKSSMNNNSTKSTVYKQ